jgi:hypothetical protein
MDTTQNEQKKKELRTLLRYAEQHPDIEIPISNRGVWLCEKDDAIVIAKLPGAKKVYSDTVLRITVPIGNGFELLYYLSRDTVCTAKRTETVLEPAREAWSYEKVVEWDCHPLLAPNDEEVA